MRLKEKFEKLPFVQRELLIKLYQHGGEIKFGFDYNDTYPGRKSYARDGTELRRDDSTGTRYLHYALSTAEALSKKGYMKKSEYLDNTFELTQEGQSAIQCAHELTNAGEH